MRTISSETLEQVVTELFSEAYEGTRQPYTWFTDNAPESGLFGTLANLSAENASSPSATGSTIAAHTEHLRWSLALANAFARGETPRVKWLESWSVRAVDEGTWGRLQDDLRREYETLKKAIETNDDWSDRQRLTGILALVPHAAYHLGAIRQMAHPSDYEPDRKQDAA